MGRKHSSGGPLLFKLALGILVIMVGWLTWHNISRLFSSGDEGGPLAMVEQFYKYEQAGDFGSAWELFDPLMQQRFSKPVYIQNRAHIIMQDFGVKTFQFHAEKPKLLTGWKMSSDADEIAEVYQIDVTQFFHTPYGNFKIVQSCFASEASGEWRLLWSYQDDEKA
ncbi:hypothetical protein KZ483_22830 [Paenibacillus sp. sptzw28]|uniref:hypothetical protein n=1 Tax=Paenibacillus sp. sptzw28 TaxID=715179 RepID=UPI001C6ECF93|nr:hypothetical protein [Paenibacillus sp. sptzw28]QYR20601.1 hypothetical protein KZ483_22830 [Paenibacillus sp. sptzw28]